MADHGAELQLKIQAELLRSYVLSGTQHQLTSVDAIKQQAAAIAKTDAEELSPIPTALIESVFRWARKQHRYPGFTELRNAWEDSNIRQAIWEEARIKERESKKALPPPPKPPEMSEEERKRQWEELAKELRAMGFKF